MRWFESAQNAFEYYYLFIQSRGENRKDTKAIFRESFTIEYPMLNDIFTHYRKWNKDYAETEWQWYLSGNRSVAEIKERAPIWDKMHHGDNLVWSNYGYWWKRNGQLERMVKLLKENPITRRAVLVHYSVDNVQEYDKDTPCNLMLNFFILDGTLQLSVFARSIDLWYGFCNDQYCFSKLLKLVADDLKILPGFMSFHITDFHIYNNKMQKA